MIIYTFLRMMWTGVNAHLKNAGRGLPQISGMLYAGGAIRNTKVYTAGEVCSAGHVISEFNLKHWFRGVYIPGDILYQAIETSRNHPIKGSSFLHVYLGLFAEGAEDGSPSRRVEDHGSRKMEIIFESPNNIEGHEILKGSDKKYLIGMNCNMFSSLDVPPLTEYLAPMRRAQELRLLHSIDYSKKKKFMRY